MEIRTYQDLEKVLKMAAKEALEDTGEETTKLVKDRIDKDVYDVEPNPTEYIRTYELRESVEPSKIKDNGENLELEVGHNTDLIISNPDLNQHASAIDGKSSVDSIAEIVNDGKSGLIFGRGYWTKKRSYMDNAQQEMENSKYKEMMKKNLEKQGFKVE